MKFRFSIRDLLWLAVVAALVVGWWVDHREMKDRLLKMSYITVKPLYAKPIK